MRVKLMVNLLVTFFIFNSCSQSNSHEYLNTISELKTENKKLQIKIDSLESINSSENLLADVVSHYSVVKEGDTAWFRVGINLDRRNLVKYLVLGEYSDKEEFLVKPLDTINYFPRDASGMDVPITKYKKGRNQFAGYFVLKTKGKEQPYPFVTNYLVK